MEEKFESNGQISLARPDARPPHGWLLSMLVGVDRIYNHRLSPDGKTIAYICNTEKLAEVYTLPAKGGWPVRQTTGRAAIQYWWDETPTWSPDSQALAFCLDGYVHVLPAAGGVPLKISGFTQRGACPVWLPDSRRLVISVERDEMAHLLLTDRQGSWPRQLTGGAGDDYDAQPSPDGAKVAYVRRPLDDLNRLDLRLVDLLTGKDDLLTGAPGQKSWQPRWSADGLRIAFLSQQTGWNEIWLADSTGSGLRRLTDAGLDFNDLAWSPDGLWLAATANRGAVLGLVLVNTRDGSAVDLRSPRGVHWHPHWAPDGRFLTFEYCDPCLPPDIYRLELNYPAAGKVLPGKLTQLTHSNLPALARLPLVIPEDIHYRSADGLEIHGLLYRPAKSNGAAIVHPHGGPRDEYTVEWDLFAQYLVAKGYTYLAVNYRGGTGYGVAFEHANDLSWGIGDTQDCLGGADFLAAQPGIDPRRIAIMGSSYGGYMVACCLSRDPQARFACGVSLYGDADLFTSWALCERTTRLYTEMQLGHPARQRAVYHAGSPIRDVANVQAPVLILHGLEDDVVPPEASQGWAEALRQAGKTFEFKTYAHESHGLLSRANLLDKYQRIERFLDWYLLPEL